MHNFAFSKINYILLVIGLAIIILGFILMSGNGTTEEAFNPDIFSDTRIKVAPMVSLFGFVFVIVAILWPSKRSRV
jgi:amino acid permease